MTNNYINSFKGTDWKNEINVSDFIKNNYTLYVGDSSFLKGISEKTKKLLNIINDLYKKENKLGVLDAETKTPQSISAYDAGYIDKDNEVIVGLQTDKPLKRGIFPKGGLRMVMNALKAYRYEIDPVTKEVYSKKYKIKTHNDGVFSVYNKDILNARHNGIITGLPDAYGRGRIIGDYRRIPLYGVDRLIEEKQKDFNKLDCSIFSEETIRLREEITDQINALKDFKEMCMKYGYDVSNPATSAKDAVQFLYFGYLAATKDQDGAAMSLGRTSTFLDIFIEKDINEGKLTEEEAQELIDQFILKLRIIRFLRTSEYNELFSGDPIWVTESIGGMTIEGKPLVTKNSYRYLNTLYNLGTAPEPNMTVLWSKQLPDEWKRFCTKVSIDTSAIQYENDDLMRPIYGDDYGIACCVSPMKIGKQMQFFGARANLAKCLLYSLNGGKDEHSGTQVGIKIVPNKDEVLNYEDVYKNYKIMIDWLAKTYINALNIIHYMHDKYNYEAYQLSLHDTNVERIFATGIAGLSVATDSLSAIKYAKVKPIRNESGLIVDFITEGEFPKYGNNDDRADDIAKMLVSDFMNTLRKYKHLIYRANKLTQSILTITSNVVYGKKTGNTPDGRKDGESFSPGANPMNGRDIKGAIASLMSVAKLPFEDAQDGISFTFGITPETLGKTSSEQIINLISLLDGYFEDNGGQHLNVNVFNKDLLIDAMNHPEKYPSLTIRVSGYAVNFNKLTKEQQLDVISRTINTKI